MDSHDGIQKLLAAEQEAQAIVTAARQGAQPTSKKLHADPLLNDFLFFFPRPFEVKRALLLGSSFSHAMRRCKLTDQLDPLVESARSLKVDHFQTVGFKYQPALLQRDTLEQRRPSG